MADKNELSIELQGGDQADKALENTEAIFRAKAFEKAMRDSVKPVVKAARRYINDRSGVLSRSVGTKLVQYTDAWVVIVDAMNKRKGFHGHNVEFGHAASGWHFEAGGEPVPPHPWMAPAIAAEARNVETNFINSVSTQVEKAFAGK